MVDIRPIDVWLRIPDNVEDAVAEANTYHDDDRFRVDWCLSAVGWVKSRYFDSYDAAAKWLTDEGFQDFTSGGDDFAPVK